MVSGSIRQNGELAPNRARPKAVPELLATAGALCSHPWGFNRFGFTADTFYFGHSYHPLISGGRIRLRLLIEKKNIVQPIKSFFRKQISCHS